MDEISANLSLQHFKIINRSIIFHLTKLKVESILKCHTPTAFSSFFCSAIKQKTNQRVLIQVNTGKDEKKHGFLKKKIIKEIKEIKKLKHIKVEGIMMIAPQNKTKEEIIKIFKKTKNLQKKLRKEIKTCKEISMGMSQDYKEAIKEGATMIRIGTALFK